MPRRIMSGKVVGCKMQKTAVIEIKKAVTHPLYKKTTFKRKKYMTHDPESKCKIGDYVRIIESRPYSKCKHWELLEIESKKSQEEKKIVKSLE